MTAPAYLVAATERSGSTLLCELLAGTGVAGRPEEYFEFLSATGRVRQPREFVRPNATRPVRRAVRPARIFMRTPRTAWPASLRHVVTRAYLRLPWRTFFAVTAN